MAPAQGREVEDDLLRETVRERARDHGLRVHDGPEEVDVRVQHPGDEREGLSAGAFALSSMQVRLPILGRGDSLNVGVSAASASLVASVPVAARTASSGSPRVSDSASS